MESSRHLGPWRPEDLFSEPVVEFGATTESLEGDRRLITSQVFYTGADWRGRPTRVFGLYSRPVHLFEATMPAMVLVHGGGGTASAEWTRLWAGRGYAALAMDLYGNGPDGRLPDGGPDWSDFDVAFRLTEGVENGWIYQGVCSIARAVSVLRSMEGVDPERVGIAGVSWGGVFTCLAMGLDERLKLAIPAYGFRFNPNTGNPPDATEEEKAKIRSLLDPANYLHQCTCPVLWVNGTQEPAGSMEELMNSVRLTQGENVLSYTVRASHVDPQMCDRGWERPEIGIFADSIFRGTPRPAKLGNVLVEGDRTMLTFESPAGAAVLAIHWTHDLHAAWPKRTWQSAYGRIESDARGHAPLPQGPATYFLTLMDERGAIVSTPLLGVGQADTES
jgi:dienelactone hydrolase